MAIHQCSICNKNFKQKSHLDSHINKKNKCKPICNEKSPKTSQTSPKTASPSPKINSITIEQQVSKNDNLICNHCNTTFARKDNLNKHMKSRCKVLLKQEIEQKNKQLEDESKFKQLEDEIKKLKDELNVVQSITINNKNCNNTINDNSINNTVNVINLVPHGSEDLIKHKIDELLLILSTKKGFNGVLELIMRVHFSSRFPEFQNVYIPDIKNKYAMVYDTEWTLKNTEDVISNLYDTKSDFIIENRDIFYKYLNPGEKIVYDRWATCNNDRNTEDFKEYITNMHEQIKLILFNKRNMVIATKKLREIK